MMIRSRSLFISKFIILCIVFFTICPAIPAFSQDSTNKIEAKTNQVWQELLQFSKNLRSNEQAVRDHAIAEAGLELGTWYCAGPFKDTALGIHIRSFNTCFGPEEQALSAGINSIDFSKTWEVEKLPGTLNTTRKWIAYPDWVDGYFHQLPIGPPPGWNETIYLYRTITAAKDVVVDVDIYAEDNVRLWLNGEKIGTAHATGSNSRFPADLQEKLALKAGENRILVKVTSMHGMRGFSFAIPLVTPSNDIRPSMVQEDSWITRGSVNRFYPGNEPYCYSNDNDESRYREYREKKDGINVKSRKRELYSSYAKALLKVLSLPDETANLLPPPGRKSSIDLIKKLYYRACHYTDALSRIQKFQCDVPVIPMFDPPKLKIAEALEETVPASVEGQAYSNRLEVLEETIETALEAANQSSPHATEKVMSAANDIEEMWTAAISSLDPIIFIKSPAMEVKAIAPYTCEGESPASICIYDPSRPQEPVRIIHDEPQGAIFDMNLSYDGKTIFFSAKDDDGIHGGWDIYEIGIDGTGLKQITYGNRELGMGSEESLFHDSNISPVELPNGELMFVSTRAGTYVNCQSEPSGFLYVSNRDGSNVRRVSGNTESDHTPQVMNDGRVLFTRWDYGVDKNVFLRQTLWTMNPDGSHFQLFSGNTIENPNGFWEARAIPGRPEVVCVFGPHHDYHAGMIGLLWNRMGFEVPRGTGFRWITQETPMVDDNPLPWGYQDPYPINERQFLVSFGGDGDYRNRIYLLDDHGNKKCIYEDENLGCWDPILLRPRKKPPVAASVSDNPEYAYRHPTIENRQFDPKMATFVVNDVYEGLLPHVERGEIKSLAVMEQLPKTAYPMGNDIWGYSPTIGRGTMFARRYIGSVPVEEDGSAHFLAPAIKDISFNALDAEGRVIMKMGSSTQAMPGEVSSCVGCHEKRAMAPPVKKKMPIAAEREPSIPKSPGWGTNGLVDFVLVVQPVLDKYCIECHSGSNPDGNVDLSDDKTRLFNMGYNQLVDRAMVNYANMNGTDHDETTPKAVGAIVSQIRDKIETDHSGQVLPLEARQRIYTWIDSGIPYYGTYSFTNAYSQGGRDRWDSRNRNGWFQKELMPAFKRRCYDCHKREINRQTYNYGPRHPDRKVTVTSDIWDEYALMTAGFSSIARMGPSHRINLTHPEWSQMVTAPLSQKAGGLGLCRDTDGTPHIFKDKNDPDYKAILAAIQKGHDNLLKDPRVDMIDQSDWPLAKVRND